LGRVNKKKIVTISDAFKTAGKFIVLHFDRIFVPSKHIYVQFISVLFRSLWSSSRDSVRMKRWSWRLVYYHGIKGFREIGW